jgi:hypothetical protein
MKSPGLVIPTPYANRKDDDDFTDFFTPNKGLCFESELTDAAWLTVTNGLSPTHDKNESDSFANEQKPCLEKEIASSAHEIDTKVTSNMEQNDDDDDDDSAFLPDDIREHLIKQASTKDVHVDNKENNHSSPKVEPSKPTREVLSATREVLTPKAPSGMISLAEVQALIDDAVREAQVQWKAHTEKELEQKNAAALEAIQQDAEKQLMEHGKQWNKEHEEELSQVKKEMESRMEQQRLEMEQDKREAEQRWMETSEQERSEFLEKMDVLVTKANTEALEHQSRTMELRAEQNAKIQRLEKELQEHQGDVEEGMASLTEATQENNTLSERISTLEATVMTLKDDKEFTQRAHEEEMQRMKDETELKLDLTIKQLIDASTVETEVLRSKISELEAYSTKVRLGHEQSLVALSEAHKMELEKQKNEFNDLIEKERQATLSIASAEKLELVAKIETLETSLVSEQEASKQGEKHHGEEMESVRKEIKEAHKMELEKQRNEVRDLMEKERQAALSIQSIASAEKLVLVAELETLLVSEREAREQDEKARAEEMEIVRKEIEEAHKMELEKQQDKFRDCMEKERQAALSVQSIASAVKLELVAKIETLISEREAREKGEKAHAEEMEIVRKEIEEAHKMDLEKQQDEFHDCMEKERQAALSIASVEKLLLDAKIETLETSLFSEREAHDQGKKVHAEEIEIVRNEKEDLEKEFLELKDSLEAERKEWKTSLESNQEEMQSRYENKIQKLEELLEKQRQDFDKEKNEIMVMQRDASTKENELSEKLVALEAQAHTDKEEYAKGLQQVRDEHTAEIDEMLAQLDLVEAEHNQKYEAKLESIKQKEAIIAALGAQLAEAAAKTIALEDERQQGIASAEAARGEAEIARTASRSLQMSLDQLRDDHRKELEKERRKRDEACQQVKEEMITAAEEQFGKANEHYVKLKHEYDSTIMKVGRIERELKSSKRELDSCKKEQTAREVETRAELAQLKAGEYFTFCRYLFVRSMAGWPNCR